MDAPGIEHPPEPEAPGWTARKLLRAARAGTLATQSAGQPFAGLVTPATAADGALLLLLSDLSEHTRHLRTDPRCAIMVADLPTETNPQTAPRLTVLTEAVIDNAAPLRARYLAVHPYAALYAEFGDFNLWRLRPLGGFFVGGFARAFRLRPDDLVPEPPATATIAAHHDEILAHCNADHAAAMEAIAGPQAVLVGVDADGADFAVGESCRRIAWSRSVADADAIRRQLILLARAAQANKPH